jgi:Nanos RNA binding domain
LFLRCLLNCTNMSRRMNKKTNEAKCCAHCKNRGKTRQVYESHNVLSEKGFVCCPDILSNRCSKCGIVGHLPSRCVRTSIKGFRITFSQPEKAVEPTLGSNRFDALAEESDDFSTPARPSKVPSSPPPPLRRMKALRLDLVDPSTEDDAPSIGRGMKPMRLNLDDCPANVTVRTKPKAKPVCWADMSDEDDDMPGPWSKLDAW